MEPVDELTRKVIGAAIEVHRDLGPGLLESAYERCLSYELATAEVPHERQVVLPLAYKGREIDAGYRLDLWVDRRVVVEVKAVERVLPIHEAQLITYLKLSGSTVGLILNFNVPRMTDGVTRRVFTHAQ